MSDSGLPVATPRRSIAGAWLTPSPRRKRPPLTSARCAGRDRHLRRVAVVDRLDARPERDREVTWASEPHSARLPWTPGLASPAKPAPVGLGGELEDRSCAWSARRSRTGLAGASSPEKVGAAAPTVDRTREAGRRRATTVRLGPFGAPQGGITMAKSGSILGNAVLRLEDPTLLTGAGQVRRRPASSRACCTSCSSARTVAHGTITSVDVSEAAGDAGRRRRVPRRRRRPRAAAVPGLPDDAGRRSNRPIFAKDKVRFVGDIVAAVVAETEAQAADAAEAVIVDYDPLPAVIDRGRRPGARRAAALPRARLQHLLRHRRSARTSTPLEGADAVAEVTMVSQRLAGVPMETQRHPGRARRADGGLTLLGLAPGAARDPRARWRRCSGSSPSSCASSCPWVGGGFGPKAAGVRRVPRRRGGRAARSAAR